MKWWWRPLSLVMSSPFFSSPLFLFPSLALVLILLLIFILKKLGFCFLFWFCCWYLYKKYKVKFFTEWCQIKIVHVTYMEMGKRKRNEERYFFFFCQGLNLRTLHILCIISIKANLTKTNWRKMFDGILNMLTVQFLSFKRKILKTRIKKFIFWPKWKR